MSDDDSRARREWATETARHLASLTDVQAAALRLRYNHGLASQEIASWLKTTRREVEIAIAEGMRRLSELIERGAQDDA